MIYPDYPWSTPFPYGVFQNGGYLYSYSQWPIYAMSLHSPARAQEAFGALLDDVALSQSAPFERVDNGVAQGTNYLQAAVSFFGCVQQSAPDWVKPLSGAITLGGSLGTETWETLGPSLPDRPAAPATLLATPGDAQVILVWPDAERATSYTLYRDGVAVEDVESPYTDTGLTNGRTYGYQVTASNDGGESPRSARKWATPGGAVTGRIADLIV
jgi:hypothetical protein